MGGVRTGQVRRGGMGGDASERSPIGRSGFSALARFGVKERDGENTRKRATKALPSAQNEEVDLSAQSSRIKEKERERERREKQQPGQLRRPAHAEWRRRTINKESFLASLSFSLSLFRFQPHGGSGYTRSPEPPRRGRLMCQTAITQERN